MRKRLQVTGKDRIRTKNICQQMSVEDSIAKKKLKIEHLNIIFKKRLKTQMI